MDPLGDASSACACPTMRCADLLLSVSTACDLVGQHLADGNAGPAGDHRGDDCESTQTRHHRRLALDRFELRVRAAQAPRAASSASRLRGRRRRPGRLRAATSFGELSRASRIFAPVAALRPSGSRVARHALRALTFGYRRAREPFRVIGAQSPSSRLRVRVCTTQIVDCARRLRSPAAWRSAPSATRAQAVSSTLDRLVRQLAVRRCSGARA